MTKPTLAEAILETLRSVNVPDSNFEPANVVDVLERIAVTQHNIAKSICPSITQTGTDAAGNTVGSLTEAVVGMTAGLMAIAEAIENHARAVRDAAHDDYV